MGPTDLSNSDADDLLDQIVADYVRALEEGDRPDRGQLLEKHPDLADHLREFFRHHDRMEGLLNPVRGAVERALNVRCPHCHNAIELRDDAPLESVSCPSCGSTFNLIAGTSAAYDPPDDKLFGHFELIERVGVGQFGSVWKALDTNLDRTVAIKIPRAGRLDADQAEVFLRDARAAAQLKHPNIAGVHEIGKHDDTIYIVTDFIEGSTLKEWMKSNRLSAREAAGLCVEIANPLHHAHESGVVHRDLKPANIMMDVGNEPHIVDFGLAKREVGEITMTIEGQILGTPAYMSPEQARGHGHSVDRRADIYSLGVILFELLTGDIPFRGDKQMLLAQIQDDDPPSPRRLNASVPRDLDTICLKCLEKDPANRYPTANRLVEDLRRFRTGSPISARPLGRTERLWRWCKRKPTTAALVGVTCLSSLVLIAGLLISNVLINDALRQRTDALNRLTTQQDATKAALKSEQQTHYYHLIRLAQSEWLASNLPRGDQFLEQCPADLRGWEWRYLKRLCNPPSVLSLKTRLSLRGTLEMTDDARLVALIENDRTLALFDTSTGERVRAFATGADAILSLAMSRNGKLLAAACQYHGTPRARAKATRTYEIKVWNAATGEQMHSFPLAGKPIYSIALDDQGERLLGEVVIASYRGGTNKGMTEVRLWNLTSGEIQSRQTRDAFCAYRFSPDGRHLAVTMRTGTRVWDARSLETRYVLPKSAGSIFDRHASFCPKSQYVACAADECVKIWDAATGTEVQSFAENRDVTCIAFGPTGGQLASGHRNGNVKIWDIKTGRQTRVLRFASDVKSIRFSPDGKRLLSVNGAWKSQAQFHVWNVADGQQAKVLEDHRGISGDVAFSPNGKLLASVGVDGMIIRDAASRKALRSISGASGRVSFSHDSGFVAAAGQGNTVRVWSVADGSEFRSFPECKAAYSSFAFSPKANVLACVDQSGTLKVWDLARADPLHEIKLFPSRQTQAESRGVAFSPDGLRIAVCLGREVHVLDLVTGAELLTLQGARATIKNVAFSPDGSRLASCHLGTIRLWDSENGREIRSFSWHGGQVGGLAFDPTGKRLAASGHSLRDSSLNGVRIWDSRTGHEVFKLRGGEFGISFSPDGRHLAAAAKSGDILLWTAAP